MSSTEPNAQPKTALVLVDVTNSFFLAGMPNFYPASAEALEPLRALLAQARSGGRIVVHAVEQHYPGYDDYEWRKLPRHHDRRPTLRRPWSLQVRVMRRL
jgi:maleamate amidohydrolase